MTNLPATLHQFSLNASSLKQVPDIAFLVFLTFFSLFALYFFFQWYKNFKKARAIEDLPTAKIRSAAQGYVEIEGKHEYLISPLVAPLSKLPCTWYRYTIDKGVKDKWYRQEQGESMQPFKLVDDTGESVVNPEGAQITCALKDTWRGFNKYPNGKPRNFIWRIICAFGNYRYTEWRMEKDTYLYVAGNFSTITDPQTHETHHLISKSGLNKHAHFIISSMDQKKLAKRHRIASFGYFISYITLLFIIGWMIVGRYY